MIKPEIFCVSLEVAQKLKEAGWDKETLFVWYFTKCVGEKDNNWKLLSSYYKYDGFVIQDRLDRIYSAPTSSEIDLPPDTPCYKAVGGKYCCFQYDSEDGDTYWHELYEEKGLGEYSPEMFYADTEVEAKAEMWLYLKENNLI
jgi:hypothetical protein